MKAFYKILSVLLLLFNSFGALYGGWNLITHPDGSSIQLSMDWLKHTPFQNYLIPGIILFTANGLFSIFAFATIVLKFPNYFLFVIAQGVILCGWIIIQIVLIQTVYFLHFIMGATGLALIITGLLQLRMSKN